MIVIGALLLIAYAIWRAPVLLWAGAILLTIGVVLALAYTPGYY